MPGRNREGSQGRGVARALLGALALCLLSPQALPVEILTSANVEDLTKLPQNPTAQQVGDLVMLTGGSGTDNNSTKIPTYDWDDANTSYTPYTGTVTPPVTNDLARGGYVTSWYELNQFYTVNSISAGSSIGIAFDINQTGGSNLQLRDLRVYGIEMYDATTGHGLTTSDLTTIFGATYNWFSPYTSDLATTDQDDITEAMANTLSSSTNTSIHQLAATPTSILSDPITLAYGSPGNTGADSVVNTNLSWSGLYGSTFDANDVFLVWVQTSAHNDGSDRVFLTSQYIVPEPSTIGLLALAGIACGARRRGRTGRRAGMTASRPGQA